MTVNARAYRNAAYSIPGTPAGWSKIPLDTTSFDPNSIWDVSTNHRATPNVAGLYQVNGAIQCDMNNTPQIVSVGIYFNGAQSAQGTVLTDRSLAALDPFAGVISDLIRFNGSTDYVELWGYNSGGNAIGLYLGPPAPPYNFLSLVMVGP